MLELRRRLDLGQEALGADGGRELGLEYLDRHFAIVPEIVRNVHRRHSADTYLGLYAIAGR